jgi:hypothetical protein
MIRIMGNSVERIPLKDLGDVIYYKQVKNITDQELEQSKDLDREIKKGRIIILEKNQNIRGSEDSVPCSVVNNNSLNINDFKTAIREVLPEISTVDIKGAVREIAPMIVDMVRQEIAKVSIVGSVSSNQKSTTEFQDPTYVPTITTEGMISNVEARKTQVSSAGAEDALAALRRLKK